jgi:hypothetical protein
MTLVHAQLSKPTRDPDGLFRPVVTIVGLEVHAAESVGQVL